MVSGAEMRAVAREGRPDDFLGEHAKETTRVIDEGRSRSDSGGRYYGPIPQLFRQVTPVEALDPANRAPNSTRGLTSHRLDFRDVGGTLQNVA